MSALRFPGVSTALQLLLLLYSDVSVCGGMAAMSTKDTQVSFVVLKRMSSVRQV